MEDLINLVEQYIEKHRLLPVRQLLVGVSGGADSMALLFVLKDIRDRKYPDMKILAAHVNHGIRKEAAEDEKLVGEYCDRLGIPLVTKHIDVPAIAEEKGISLETAGRIARYDFFRSAAGDSGVTAVAHHMEDQAESIAMHIFRGCGMEGLVGIRPRNGNVIHPFLCAHKKDILDFCKKKSIPFCNDVTNADITYDRNFWRNEIFPSIEKGTNRNPVAALTGLSERIYEENAYLDELAEEKLDQMIADTRDLSVPADELRALPPVIRRRALKLLAVWSFGNVVDLEACHWDAIMDLTEKSSGSSYIDLPGDRIAAREGGMIRFLFKESAFDGEKSGYVEGAGFVVPETMAEEEIALRNLPLGEKINFSQSFVSMRLRSIEKEAEVVYNDTTWIFPSTVLEHAVIRTRRQGDTICRAGNTCTKELRRFMNEVHILPRYRDRVLLVAEGQETLWLPAFGHAVGYTDALSEARYRETTLENESAGERTLYVLEFFGETADMKGDQVDGTDFGCDHQS